MEWRIYLPDGSYSASYIQYYFECILKKHGEKTYNPSRIIYLKKKKKKIENRITFRIKTRYLEHLTPETMSYV